MKPIYKRIMLKLSGEGLMGEQAYGISPQAVRNLATQVKAIHDLGVELCIVVGGGNIFRGIQEAAKGIDRTVGDYLGMTATIMNAVYFQNVLESLGVPARVMSGLQMPQVCEPYIFRKALHHLQKKRVVIFAGGTGCPFFTTDTGAALRAAEMHCQAILKSTQVDGVYDSDPKVNPQARRFEEISFDEIIARGLKVMDLTAVTMARDNNIPMIVFSQHAPDALLKAVCGEGKFTIIKKEG